MRTYVAMLLVAVSGYTYAGGGVDGMASDESVARGQTVYGKYCTKCHGQDADGHGKDSWKYKPMPTNFHIALAAPAYEIEMVQKGGKALGRSEDMPDWGDDLSAEQIQDVVSYVVSLRGQ